MMFKSAKPARDPFTFSLTGMAAINTHAIPAVVANNTINEAWNRRLDAGEQGTSRPTQLVARIEELLARYFAPCECHSAC